MSRSPLRWLSTLMLLLGLLALAEATLTVLWQEPFTAAIARGKQSELTRQYQQVEKLNGTKSQSRAELRRLAARYRRGLRAGDPVGILTMPTIDRRFTVVQDAQASQLAKGPGHIVDTRLPGEGGTFGVAGHRTTYMAPFRHIDDLEVGDPLTVRVPYAIFSYRVTGTRIVAPTEVDVKRSVGFERLILSACHPVYSAAKRIVVFARLRAVSPPG